MTSQVCPLLGTLDANNRRGPHVEFPSFENQCLAGGAPELILLGDQATSCLAAGHTACPRFRKSRQAQEADAPFVPFYVTAEEAWQQQRQPGQPGASNIAMLDDAADGAAGSRARWGRLGAALIFLTVILCGSTTAAYVGWDWITRDLRPPTAAGRVDLAAQTVGQSQPTPAVYVVMTATPVQVAAAVQPPGQAGVTGLTEPGTNTGIIPVLPPAVTPTPIRIELAAPAVITPEQSPGGDPAIDVDQLVPTRRPTPEFDVPTSTPLVAEPPTVTPLLTPTETPTPLGTPIIIFAPVDKELEKGECTMVRWNVQNVREVYYENLPMNGQGEREECINDENETYTLLVVLSNGQPQTYTTTVSYLPPTPTPTVTPSFTPEPDHTATWTPEPPTATAPPNNFYAVNIAVNGPSEITCAAGQTCEVGLLATNGGSGTDNISVLLLGSDAFAVELCRPDGVCGGGSVPILNMGAGNTAFVVARFSVPAGASAGTRGTATFQARSDGSGGGVMSSQISVAVTVQ